MTSNDLLSLLRFRVLDYRNATEEARERLMLEAAEEIERLRGAADETAAPRPCTCHPDDNPPRPCPQKFALSECRRFARTIEDVLREQRAPDKSKLVQE